MQMEAVRRLTILAREQGLEGVEKALDRVSAAQERVGRAGDALAQKSETSARRQLSAAGSFDRIVEKHDRVIYLQRKMAQEMDMLNRALDAGARDALQHAQAVDLVASSYERAIAAEIRRRNEARLTSQANDSVAQSAMRLAAANDNARGSTANVAAQFQDIGVTAAMGMNPIMIALQQGTQLSAVLNSMQNPLRGLGAAFLSIINPVSLLTIGFVALTAASIQWFTSANKGAESAEDALERHSKWLDQLLAGYDAVRDAAQQAADAALKLPTGVVASDLTASLRQQEKALAALGQRATDLQQRLEAAVGVMKATDALDPISPMFGGNLVGQVAMLSELSISASSTREELDAAATAARELYNATRDPGVRDMAEQVYALAIELRNTNAVIDSTVTGINSLNMTDLSGMEKWSSIANDTRLGLSMVERAAIAAAWAIANSGGAAVVAAGQYGTATGAANAYANALFRLGSLIPEVAAAQAQFGQLQQAERDHSAAIRENKNLLDMRAISLDEFVRRQGTANELYARAQDQVTGLTDANRRLAQAEREAEVGAMSAREAAAARIRDRYAEIEEALTKANAGPDALARATAAMNQELANSNASFDQMGAKAGGAGSALKAAEKDFNSFIDTADRLAEALFPGEFARREANELMALLDRYRDKLDGFQRQAVEAEIGNLNRAADLGLRRLEDRAEEAGDRIMKTLGSVLSSLFDGPIEDADDFFSRMFGGLGQLGQQNLSMLFEKDGGLAKLLESAVGKGTETGWLKAIGGMEGLGGMAQAGLGGLGIGYQTQNPIMGALGGALAGFATGNIFGAVIGGIAGFLGGLFGMNEALEAARKKVEQNRLAIEQFIAAANGDQISRYARTLADLNKQALELIELAEKAGDTALVNQLKAANDNIPATLAKAMQDEVRASIHSLRGEDYINKITAAQTAYNLRLKDAALLNVDAGESLVEFNLALHKVISESELTQAQIERLTHLFPALADQIRYLAGMMSVDQALAAVERARQDLRSSYEAEASALRQLIDRNRQFIKSMEDFRSSLRLDKELGGLSPQDRLAEARRQFETISAKANLGDEDAMAKLEAVSRTYLEAARGYYASSEQYYAVLAQVERAIDQSIKAAEGRVSDGERQLLALDEQVRRLIDIDRSVLSVAAAIERLNQSIIDLATVQAGGHVPLPGFAAGGSFTVGGRGGVDSNLLSVNGRPVARVSRSEVVSVKPANGGDAALQAEVRALREEVAAMRREMVAVSAAGAQAVSEAVTGTTAAVRDGNRLASQAALRK